MKLNVIHPVEILRQQLVVVFRPAVDILRFENRRNNAFFQKHLRRAVNAGLHKDRRGDRGHPADPGIQTFDVNRSIAIHDAVVDDNVCQLPQVLAAGMLRRQIFRGFQRSDRNDLRALFMRGQRDFHRQRIANCGLRPELEIRTTTSFGRTSTFFMKEVPTPSIPS